jgi:hypothetical protein
MAHPKAYDPQPGYKYQILCKGPGERSFEHCDYATDRGDKLHLLTNYRQAYGGGYEFKTIMLPSKYWPKTSSLVEAQSLARAHYNRGDHAAALDVIKRHAPALGLDAAVLHRTPTTDAALLGLARLAERTGK